MRLAAKAQRAFVIAEIKRVIEAHQGNVGLSAQVLEVPYWKLSRMLNGRALRPWWRKFKDKAQKARRRARNERWQARREARDGYGDENIWGGP